MEFDGIRKSLSETLIISLLKESPMHGYEMCTEIERRSNGFFTFRHSTLYPVLHKLEKKGLIKGKWRTGSTQRPRKYYTITKKGISYYYENAQSWKEFFGIIQKLIPEMAQ